MIVSVHIPKTAGTTFRHCLELAFPDGVLDEYGFDTMGISELLESCFEDILSIKETGFFRLKRISEGILRLRKALSQRGIQVIHGHFAVSQYLGVLPDATYVTWLRDPLQRALSHYNHRRRDPGNASDGDNQANRLIYEGKVTFEEWMLLEDNINFQHQLVGSDLNKFQFVGIVEEFEPCLSMFSRLIGLSPLTSIEPLNRNPEKDLAAGYQIEDSTRERFLELNSMDVVLYRQAVARFEQDRKEPRQAKAATGTSTQVPDDEKLKAQIAKLIITARPDISVKSIPTVLAPLLQWIQGTSPASSATAHDQGVSD